MKSRIYTTSNNTRPKKDEDNINININSKGYYTNININSKGWRLKGQVQTDIK